MAWCAWNAMMLHVVMQFCNKMCFGSDIVLNFMTLWIDLIFDDIVQLTALGMFWHKEGFSAGDPAAAILSGGLASMFAIHNLTAICMGSGAGGKKQCWGKGHTKSNYRAADHVDDAWCPYCTCPLLAKCCHAMCGGCCQMCCPSGPQARFKCLCFKSCYLPVIDEENEIHAECNIVCYQFDLMSSGAKEAASCGAICCHIMSNTWMMALWAVHVGGVSAFLIKYHGCDDNPYPCPSTVTYSYIALAVGGMTLLIAYILEGTRAKWLADHGVEGHRTNKVSKRDFKLLA